jgi:hypothetical protein
MLQRPYWIYIFKIADVLYHYTITFSSVSEGYREYDQSFPITAKSTLAIPVILSECGITLQRRMLDKILYEDGSSDMPW